MSQERRFQRAGARRIGTAATIMSAGTFVLLFAGVPAHAGVTVSKPCPEPTTPAEAPAYWQCLWDNVQDGLNPQPEPQEPDEPEPAKPPADPKPDKPAPDKPEDSGDDGSTPERDRTPSAPSGGSGNAPAAYTQPGGLRPYDPGTAPQLPGLLPAPQVAPGARTAPAMGLGETRLITPVAAYERQEDRMLWVAVAAGAAGAVGALNISVLTRRPRRRPGA